MTEKTSKNIEKKLEKKKKFMWQLRPDDEALKIAEYRGLINKHGRVRSDQNLSQVLLQSFKWVFKHQGPTAYLKMLRQAKIEQMNNLKAHIKSLSIDCAELTAEIEEVITNQKKSPEFKPFDDLDNGDNP